MGMKEIKDREKDWPGSSHWKQAPEYQWALLGYLWAGSCDSIINELTWECQEGQTFSDLYVELKKKKYFFFLAHISTE